MARGDQLGRQWKIIQFLISSRRGKSVAQLAEHLGCHPRTVYRDMEALQIAGFPVFTEKDRGRTLWALLETFKDQIPLPLNLAELMALYFSRNMLKILENTIYYDSLESLFQKIKITLPQKYLESLEKIDNGLHVGLKPYKNYSKTGDIINAANQAVADGKWIDIAYFTMSRKKLTQRRIAPYKVWYFDGTFYLIGYCNQRKEIRIFALDRIKQIELTDNDFERPSPADIDAIMKSSFGIFLGRKVKVRVRFAADIAGYIKEKTWHESQTIEEADDGSLVFEAEVAGLREIKFWLMTWGAKAHVLEPEELRREICAEAEKILADYCIRHSIRP